MGRKLALKGCHFARKQSGERGFLRQRWAGLISREVHLSGPDPVYPNGPNAFNLRQAELA